MSEVLVLQLRSSILTKNTLPLNYIHVYNFEDDRAAPNFAINMISNLLRLFRNTIISVF